jgi:hypothetical protein
MAKPASRSPANVTITKHRMAPSVLRHAQTGAYDPVLLPPIMIVQPPTPVSPTLNRRKR